MDYQETNNTKYVRTITHFEPGIYYVLKDRKIVLYAVNAHGKLFTGKAKCGAHDEFDVEKGKVLAHMRAVLKQRQYDLELTRRFITMLQYAREFEMDINEGIASPHFMRSIQAACDEEKAQLNHIKDLKMRIEEEVEN